MSSPSSSGRLSRRLTNLAIQFRPHGTENKTAPSLLTYSTALLSVLGIYVYFTGWVYVYFYYKDFGVRIFSFDIPVTFFLVYAYEPFRTALGMAVVALFLIAAALYAANRIPQFAFFVLLAAAFPALFFVAKDRAHQASDGNRRYPTGTIQLKFRSRAGDEDTSELDEANRNQELHLLLETKDRVLVFYQPLLKGTRALPAVRVYSIAHSDLLWTTMISDR